MSGTLLFYDTETSSLPNWKAPSEDPSQPYILQLTALLTDLDGGKLASMDTLIAIQDRVQIHPDAAAAHGITKAKLAQAGIPMSVALATFLALWDRADMRIGHAETFDARMVRIELIRHRGRGEADIWKKGQSFCTMQASRDICKIPPTDAMAATNRLTYKSPKLAEAYKHFTGQDLGDKAHNAMFDVLACKTVFFYIQEHYKSTANPRPEHFEKPSENTTTFDHSLFGDEG